MDGTYYLKTRAATRPAHVCVDGCIYWRGGNREEEFCFVAADLGDTTQLQCQVSTVQYSTVQYKVSKGWMLKLRNSRAIGVAGGSR